MKHCSVFGFVFIIAFSILSSGCNAPVDQKIELPQVAQKIGVQISEVEYAEACSFAESILEVGPTRFLDGMAVVTKKNLFLVKRDGFLTNFQYVVVSYPDIRSIAMEENVAHPALKLGRKNSTIYIYGHDVIFPDNVITERLKAEISKQQIASEKH